MIKVSSTNLSQRQGVWESAKSFDLKLFHEHVCNERTNRGTHSSTLNLFIIPTLEEEVCVIKAELQKGDYILDYMMVLCCNVGSSVNFFVLCEWKGQLAQW